MTRDLLPAVVILPMRCFIPITWLVAGAILAWPTALAPLLAQEKQPLQFEQHIQPILLRHCSRCHGPTNPKGELNLATGMTLLKGSESGPVVVAGKPAESRLFELVESGEMPPEEDKRLSGEDVALIKRWIDEGAAIGANTNATQVLTQHDTLPILLLRCAACHGRQKQEAGLDVRSKATLLNGGKSGPAMVAGNADESLLIKRIASGEMPPKEKLAAHSVKPVEAAELDKLRQWIAQGAPEVELTADVANGQPDPMVSDQDRQFWSFQPPRPVKIPTVPGGVAANPIDSFVLQKLRAAGLELSPTADRLTLLRRVYFDLIGLPPDPATSQEFVNDPDPLAFERQVDELLASPQYGERWGQYWLDLAGYSDSEGVQDSDLVRSNAYRYRDYVIQSFNAAKPYDRLLLEQLAGDELADYEHATSITQDLYDNLVATGFLRMSADGTFSGITGFVPDRLDVIDDELRVLGSSVMGLTIGCARCHSHKFDPIPQRDYYRLAAVFKGALDEHDWLKPTRQNGPPGQSDRFLTYVPSDERAAWEASQRNIDDQIAALKKQLDEAKENAELKKTTEEKIKSLEAQRQPEPLIRALWDRGEPSPTYLLRRGNYLTPSRLVGPGLLSVLTDGKTPFAPEPPWPGAPKTGMRLAFARWLTRPDHPLTARVLVNRVWKHHFGEGLVRTVENFGHAGQPPTHPELLDWLSLEFVNQGWSIKNLHRLILTSAVYRQSSVIPDSNPQSAIRNPQSKNPQSIDPQSKNPQSVDPENQLLWHMPLRRLDAESLRDTLVALAGCLDFRQFGPADPVEARPDGLVTSRARGGGHRRSIYVLQRRTQPLTILADFDRPAMSPNCTQRVESTVAPQALHLLNSRFVYELSQAFAERTLADSGNDSGKQLERIHWLAYGRPPTPEELDQARRGLAELQASWQRELAATQNDPAALAAESSRKALTNYCHAVMNSAGLIFVD